MSSLSLFFYACDANLGSRHDGSEDDSTPLSASCVKERLLTTLSLFQHLEEDEIEKYVTSAKEAKEIMHEASKLREKLKDESGESWERLEEESKRLKEKSIAVGALSTELERMARGRSDSCLKPLRRWEALEEIVKLDLDKMPVIRSGSQKFCCIDYDPQTVIALDKDLKDLGCPNRGELLTSSVSQAFDNTRVVIPLFSKILPSIQRKECSSYIQRQKAALHCTTSIGMWRFRAFDSSSRGGVFAAGIANYIREMFELSTGVRYLIRCIYLSTNPFALESVLSTDTSEWCHEVKAEVGEILESWGLKSCACDPEHEVPVWSLPRDEGDRRAAFVVLAWDADVFEEACSAVENLLKCHGRTTEEYVDTIDPVMLDGKRLSRPILTDPGHCQSKLFDYVLAVSHWTDDEREFLKRISGRKDIVEVLWEGEKERTIVLVYEGESEPHIESPLGVKVRFEKLGKFEDTSELREGFVEGASFRGSDEDILESFRCGIEPGSFIRYLENLDSDEEGVVIGGRGCWTPNPEKGEDKKTINVTLGLS
eukprot:TRINITY_DN275_c0_g4_i1.p1 TRINITY_DN275_c0_g4~~TRINITY_DN275_c0_g4_i1.p1  ORF type:complete len:540 (+),score=117.46 TRINITY_DN275_c0_g4_i1:91-1710(+)